MATASSNIPMIKDAIKECEARIASLSNQLKEVQEEQRRWERQLAFAMAMELDHLNKCPAETLIKIFEICLAPNHLRIRTLLLVCKKWYQLIVKTPTLWNRIEVCFPEYYSLERPICLITYVKVCKQRSGDLKLEVTLDFEGIVDAVDYHKGILSDLIQGECFKCFLDGLNPDYSYQFECSTYKRRMKQLIDTVRALVGEGSKDMKRWSSFHLTLPYKNGGLEEIIPTLSLLNGPMNSLYNLSIERTTGWHDHSSYDKLFDRFPGLNDCSRVERLKLRRTRIELIPIQYSAIKYLDIVVDHGRDLSNISNLRSLETLAITVSRMRLNSNVDLFRKGKVHYDFPYLRYVKITGRLNNDWFGVLNFNTPSLRNVSVDLQEWIHSSTLPFSAKSSQNPPLIVTFTAGDVCTVSSGKSKRWSNTEFEIAFRQVLTYFSSAEQITFRISTDEILREVLSGRIKGGQQSPTVFMEVKGDLIRLHHAETIEPS
jgi:hypothetical protein